MHSETHSEVSEEKPQAEHIVTVNGSKHEHADTGDDLITKKDDSTPLQPLQPLNGSDLYHAMDEDEVRAAKAAESSNHSRFHFVMATAGTFRDIGNKPVGNETV